MKRTRETRKQSLLPQQFGESEPITKLQSKRKPDPIMQKSPVAKRGRKTSPTPIVSLHQTEPNDRIENVTPVATRMEEEEPPQWFLKYMRAMENTKSNTTTHTNNECLSPAPFFARRPLNNYRPPALNAFTGKKDECFTTWFIDFETTISGVEMNEHEKVGALKRHLQGKARENFEGYSNYQTKTLEDAANAMKAT